jgi:hypothetical protein
MDVIRAPTLLTGQEAGLSKIASHYRKMSPLSATEKLTAEGVITANVTVAKTLLLVNQREKYHMGPLIRCGGRRSACACAFLADLPISHSPFMTSHEP